MSCFAVRDVFPRLFAVIMTDYISLIENFTNYLYFSITVNIKLFAITSSLSLDISSNKIPFDLFVVLFK